MVKKQFNQKTKGGKKLRNSGGRNFKGKIKDKTDSSKFKNSHASKENLKNKNTSIKLSQEDGDLNSNSIQAKDEQSGNNADFYLDDQDLDLVEDSLSESGSQNLSMSEDDAGSELDFGEEDYVESEDEDVQSGEDQKREKKLTKLELKKLINKCGEGAPMAITKMIILFSKITSNSQKLESLDEDNALNKPKIVQNLLKFCIKNLAEILVLKIHSINAQGVKENSLSDKSSVIKNLIKRYLGVLTKYIKTTENAMLAFIYKNMGTISELIFVYKNFIEIFLKLSIKVWADKHGTNTSSSAFRLVKEILQKKPEHFENSLKLFYINYLEVAKATNWNTIMKIKQMQDEIISLLSLDTQKAYITIFTFIRKMCLQLRLTINDRKAASIKNIYNWQFINSIQLWTRVVSKYYTVKTSDINLLAYPLIQTLIGVIRLNLVDTFFPLKIFLVNLLNQLSYSTGIFIPVSSYLLEIIESSHFKGKFKEKNVTQSENTTAPDVNVNLKFKDEDFKNYGFVSYLLEETLDSLCEFLASNSHKFSFPEIAFGVSYNLKKIAKNMMVRNKGKLKN
jgi:nucleolar complex protein 2